MRGSPAVLPCPPATALALPDGDGPPCRLRLDKIVEPTIPRHGTNEARALACSFKRPRGDGVVWRGVASQDDTAFGPPRNATLRPACGQADRTRQPAGPWPTICLAVGPPTPGAGGRALVLGVARGRVAGIRRGWTRAFAGGRRAPRGAAWRAVLGPIRLRVPGQHRPLYLLYGADGAARAARAGPRTKEAVRVASRGQPCRSPLESLRASRLDATRSPAPRRDRRPSHPHFISPDPSLGMRGGARGERTQRPHVAEEVGAGRGRGSGRGQT